MKAILLAGLLLGAAPAFPQKGRAAPAVGQESNEPFKRANAVIVHTTDSVGGAYQKMAGVLLGAGYTIDRADKGLGFLNTKPRPTPKLNGLHTLRAAIVPTATGADIQLRSSFSMPGAAAVSPIMAGELETELRGGNGSLFMICWNELVHTAMAYPGGRVAYSKAP